MDEGPGWSDAGSGEPVVADGSGPQVAPVPVAGPEAFAGPEPSAGPGPVVPPRRRRAGLMVGAAVVVVAAAVGIVVGATSGSHTGTGPSPTSGTASNAVVLDAIDSTLGAKTADLHMAVAIDIPGAATITATGDGQTDFATGASEVHVAYQGLPSALGGLQMTELYTGGDLYLSMPQIATVVPGKSWISQPVGSSSVAPGSSDPSDMFRILRNRGDQVTSLGSSVLDGASVDGYHVVVTPAAIRNQLGRSDLPAGMAQAAQSMMGSGGIAMDVYVDASTGLLRRVVAALHMTLAGRTVSGTATEDASDFGVPVSITAPPANQVVSFQQFEQAVTNAIGSAPGT
jgi:hypothetical protein